jgi:hypothetical protein
MKETLEFSDSINPADLISNITDIKTTLRAIYLSYEDKPTHFDKILEEIYKLDSEIKKVFDYFKNYTLNFIIKQDFTRADITQLYSDLGEELKDSYKILEKVLRDISVKYKDTFIARFGTPYADDKFFITGKYECLNYYFKLFNLTFKNVPNAPIPVNSYNTKTPTCTYEAICRRRELQDWIDIWLHPSETLPNWAIAENNALRPYLVGGEKFQREQANAFFDNNEYLRASGHIYENPLICDGAGG